MFSRSKMSPCFKPSANFFTSSPTQSGAKITLRCNSSVNLRATGARLIFGLTLPSGLPRWLAMTGIPPCSRIYLMVGSDALILVSSVIFISSSRGTLKSTRTKTFLPLIARSLTENFATILFLLYIQANQSF